VVDHLTSLESPCCRFEAHFRNTIPSTFSQVCPPIFLSPHEKTSPPFVQKVPETNVNASASGHDCRPGSGLSAVMSHWLPEMPFPFSLDVQKLKVSPNSLGRPPFSLPASSPPYSQTKNPCLLFSPSIKDNPRAHLSGMKQRPGFPFRPCIDR